MSISEDFTPADLGERLRRARESAGITQADAALAAEVARTTLVAIEQGQRRIRIQELQRLARLYHTSVNALVREESIHVDLTPKFRKLNKNVPSSENRAIQLLADLARAEVELENLLGVKRVTNYPPERPILRGDVQAQADQDALELRQRLGLGIAPIPDIISLLELEIGVRVYVRRLDANISGLFAYDDAVGACMLLNASHPKTRRAQTAAHEWGHFMSTRHEPDILLLDEIDNSKEERYANSFGRSLLTPARAVKYKFDDVVAGSDRLTRRHVIVLAHFFSVSREAMVRRLEELKLVKLGTWDWFQDNNGITDEQEKQVLGDLRSVDTRMMDFDSPTTLRLSSLASEVYRQGIMSEGQLSRLLQIDRIELRGILDGLEAERSEADGVPKLPD
jgi:Zn-dependent peptidase ImmA (M78 family)/transcriptional regulator with XRE-family HTH domain